jgi:uncharacterized surface protein with fasciclin (FAS1) repeats
MNIVETAIATPQLSSLVAALQAADGNLVNVLNGSGPFTVLAPTNDAFDAFLSANGFASLDQVPTDVLSQILLNHVIAGNVTSTTLTTAGSGYANTSATGPGGNNLSLYFNTTTADGVEFNNVSSVVAGGADISATNGTVHIVDAVIGLPTVVDFALANPALSNLVAALQLADSQNPSPGLIPTLQGTGPFTVFAPTDAAFGDLLLELDPSGNTALGDLDPALVQSVLTYHVVSGNVTSSQLTTGPVTTLGGTITADASNFTLTDPNDRVSNIITTLVNIQAANGVVHAIDKVILPPL